MGSFSSLNIGASALYVSQRAVELAAHNLANAQTEGYTRQRLAITSAPPTTGTIGVRGDGMRGTGVVLVDIQRLRDDLTDVTYRGEASAAGAATARATVLERAQGVLGPYGAGAPATLTAFFAAWDQLSLAPTDPSARANVLDTGSELAGGLRGASTALTQLAIDVGLRVDDQVGQVNQLAKQVAELNQQIADARIAAQSPNDLLDQRDLALDRLSKIAGATVQFGELDMANVFVGNSVLVAAVGVRPLETSGTGTLKTIRFSDGGEAAPGGELGGAMRAIKVDLPAYQAQLDAFAVDLATRVNAVHAAGYSLEGPQPDEPGYTAGGNGGDLFTDQDGGTEISASNIRLRPGITGRDVAASESGWHADGNHALTAGRLRTTDLGDGLRAITSRLGSDTATAQRAARAATTGLDGAAEVRAQVNGVNTDEEMVDLVKFQKAFEAAARVLSVVDGMLDVLINRTGR